MKVNLPHDQKHDFHDRFVQGNKKVLERLCFFSQTTQHDTKNHTEQGNPKYIDTWYRFQATGNSLAWRVYFTRYHGDIMSTVIEHLNSGTRTSCDVTGGVVGVVLSIGGWVLRNSLEE